MGTVGKKKFGSSPFSFLHHKRRGVAFYGKRFFLIMGIGFGGFGLYKIFYGDGSGKIPVIEAIPGYPIRFSRLASTTTEEKKLAPHVEEYITGQSSVPQVEKLLPPPEKPIVEAPPLTEEDVMEKAIHDTLQNSTAEVQNPSANAAQKTSVPVTSSSLAPRPVKVCTQKRLQIGPFFVSRAEVTRVFRLFKRKLRLPPGASFLIQYDRSSKQPRYRILICGIASEENLKKVQAACAKQKIPVTLLP